MRGSAGRTLLLPPSKKKQPEAVGASGCCWFQLAVNFFLPSSLRAATVDVGQIEFIIEGHQLRAVSTTSSTLKSRPASSRSIARSARDFNACRPVLVPDIHA